MAKLLAIFAAVFVAELGDKTQLATLMFSAEGGSNPWLVFLAASAALVASTGVAVAVGTMGAHWLQAVPLKLIAGLGFIAIGIWTLAEYFRAT